MMRREPWTLAELLVVMEHPELSDEELAAKLGNRGDVGTGAVRIGLHAYHENEAGPAQQTFLPQVCRAYLSRADRPKVACPKCGIRF